MTKFEMLCEALPADVNWGNPITPDVVEQIILAEREACAKAAEGFTDGRDDRKWVPGSLYDTLRRETAAFIRKRSNA